MLVLQRIWQDFLLVLNCKAALNGVMENLAWMRQVQIRRLLWVCVSKVPLEEWPQIKMRHLKRYRLQLTAFNIKTGRYVHVKVNLNTRDQTVSLQLNSSRFKSLMEGWSSAREELWKSSATRTMLVFALFDACRIGIMKTALIAILMMERTILSTPKTVINRNLCNKYSFVG